MVRTLVFAGGGTAGHVEPALAVALAWKSKYPHDRCIFLGTPIGLENTLVPAAGFELHTIEKVTMPRRVDLNLLKLPLRLFRAVDEAKKIMHSSDLLVGFGGYLSASAYLAASRLKIPIVIHEANTKVGWANRLGALLTDNLAVARPVSSGKFSHASLTGLPLRADVVRAFHCASGDWHRARIDAKIALGWNPSHPTLLVLGGSQGSTFINSQIALALPALEGKGIQILHSVGASNELPQTQTNYKAVPYIDDMATAYLAADVVVARSGAVTCAEFAALGRLAVFVPLPIGNGEQARNADTLVEVGRALVVSQSNFSATWLLENIDQILERSSISPESGLDLDIDAEQRIIALMEKSIQGESR